MKGMITIMKKKLYFGTNLKMYENIKMTTDYLQALINHTRDISFDEITLFVIPSFTSLNSAVKAAERSALMVGAQDMCWENSGQFTGEISPLMLKELGLDLVMIGHSERRHIFKETDVIENKKVNAALSHGFTTLLLVFGFLISLLHLVPIARSFHKYKEKADNGSRTHLSSLGS